jgi:hypothetical protein
MQNEQRRKTALHFALIILHFAFSEVRPNADLDVKKKRPGFPIGSESRAR